MGLNAPSITMNLNDYRGKSAYEIALEEGFVGTKKEWLDSLKGEPGVDGDSVTVNKKRAVDGNVTVNATDIKMQAGSETSETVYEAVSGNKEAIAGHDEKIVTLEEKADLLADEKASAVSVQTVLKADSWTPLEDGYEQTVEVAGVTADENRIHIIPNPIPSQYAMYSECQIRAASQGNGTLTFAASDIPEANITVNILIVDSGVSA